MKINKEGVYILAMRSNAYIFSFLTVGIAGSNPTEIIVFRVLCLLG